MKRLLILLLAVFLNAETLNFILPFKDSNSTENNTSQQTNKFIESNITKTDTNKTQKTTETNITTATITPAVPDNNYTAYTSEVYVEDFNDSYVTINN